ncbi:MAG: diaminopimelate epimerase [Bdellovibrio sp.]|nr:diaminopimelate epimerase [Methylotenera sp.]
MQLNFTKMQGAGNDFLMIDGFSAPINLTATQIKKIANRNFGVGCDQLLIVEKTNLPNVDFKYRIFNADGGEVEQCGNGARCFVRFVVDKALTHKKEITVETASGLITLTLQDDGQVTVNMGAPIFEPAKIPFIADERQSQYLLKLRQESLSICAVSMGNPHAVTLVDDVETADVATLGPQIEAHASFPQRVNAGFMQIVDAHNIKLRVYERGSGETLACGTGACAAAVSGIMLGLLQSPVMVHARGGDLTIAWAGVDLNSQGMPVMMTGNAEIVFEGIIII